MHELGGLEVRDGVIYTKVSRNLRRFRIYDMYLVIPYSSMSGVISFYGDNAKSHAEDYILAKSSRGYQVFVVSQEDLENKGYSIDEVCSILNYIMNSPSCLALPNLVTASPHDMRKFIKVISEEGW